MMAASEKLMQEICETTCLFARRSNKQQNSGRIISNFTKGQTFSSFMTTKCSWE